MAFPDITEDLRAYLLFPLSSVPISSEVPDPRPAEFVQLYRVGGLPPGDVRDTARIDIRVWAASRRRAMELLLTVRAQIWALPGTTELGYAVYQVAEFLGPRHDTDTETGVPQAWFTPELTYRADDVLWRAQTAITP